MLRPDLLGLTAAHSIPCNLDDVVRRLFSTFAHGWPGVGLLLMRLPAGIIPVVHGVMALLGGPPIAAAILHGLTAGIGILVLIGLWTPFAAAILAIIALWHAFMHSGSPLNCVLLATLGAALALLGPGGWSVDARLFGWKRIDIPD